MHHTRGWVFVCLVDVFYNVGFPEAVMYSSQSYILETSPRRTANARAKFLTRRHAKRSLTWERLCFSTLLINSIVDSAFVVQVTRLIGSIHGGTNDVSHHRTTMRHIEPQGPLNFNRNERGNLRTAVAEFLGVT